MNRKFISGLFILFILYSISIDLHAQFTIDAQLRNRMEFRDGYKQLAAKGSIPSVIISQRTRIGMSNRSELLLFKISLQDVRVWGDEDLSSSTGVYGDKASVALFEGYAQLKINKTNSISIGRQQLAYDNQRLIAARNWNQNGLAYDALVIKTEVENWKIHLASSWNSLSETTSNNYYPPTRIKSFNYIWAQKRLSDTFQFSLLHITSGKTENEISNALHFKHTSGFYTKFSQKNIHLWANAYYQYGQNQTGIGVSALLFDFDLSFQENKATMGLGTSYLSGNSLTGSKIKTDHLFDALYGARHKYFGSLDYFRSFSSHTNQGGLTDFYAYLNYSFSKKLTLQNTGHYFLLSQTNSTTPNDKKLGYENDFTLKLKFSKWGKLELGHSFILPSTSLLELQELSQNKFSQFIYLQFTLSPALFTNTSKTE